MEIVFIEQGKKKKTYKEKNDFFKNKTDFSIYANVSISTKYKQNKMVPLSE